MTFLFSRSSITNEITIDYQNVWIVHISIFIKLSFDGAVEILIFVRKKPLSSLKLPQFKWNLLRLRTIFKYLSREYFIFSHFIRTFSKESNAHSYLRHRCISAGACLPINVTNVAWCFRNRVFIIHSWNI